MTSMLNQNPANEYSRFSFIIINSRPIRFCFFLYFIVMLSSSFSSSYSPSHYLSSCFSLRSHKNSIEQNNVSRWNGKILFFSFLIRLFIFLRFYSTVAFSRCQTEKIEKYVKYIKKTAFSVLFDAPVFKQQTANSKTTLLTIFRLI